MVEFLDTRNLPVTSGLPRSTDILRVRRHVSKVRNSDVPTNSIDDRQRHQFGMKSARPTTPRENRSTDGIEQTALEQKQTAQARPPICISGDVAIRGPRTVPAY